MKKMQNIKSTVFVNKFQIVPMTPIVKFPLDFVKTWLDFERAV